MWILYFSKSSSPAGSPCSSSERPSESDTSPAHRNAAMQEPNFWFTRSTISSSAGLHACSSPATLPPCAAMACCAASTRVLSCSISFRRRSYSLIELPSADVDDVSASSSAILSSSSSAPAGSASHTPCASSDSGASFLPANSAALPLASRTSAPTLSAAFFASALAASASRRSRAMRSSSSSVFPSASASCASAAASPTRTSASLVSAASCRFTAAAAFCRLSSERWCASHSRLRYPSFWASALKSATLSRAGSSRFFAWSILAARRLSRTVLLLSSTCRPLAASSFCCSWPTSRSTACRSLRLSSSPFLASFSCPSSSFFLDVSTTTEKHAACRCRCGRLDDDVAALAPYFERPKR
mmetsp:Transcript_22752/g.75465  ORF Transcript_22752/g.75465 Transcript_22752/m.75465 type:complete len:358 (+) Transcript_22752:533-1606(+)